MLPALVVVAKRGLLAPHCELVGASSVVLARRAVRVRRRPLHLPRCELRAVFLVTGRIEGRLCRVELAGRVHLIQLLRVGAAVMGLDDVVAPVLGHRRVRRDRVV